MSKKTQCEGCGKMAAGGGRRFCYSCICILLSPRPQPPGTPKPAMKEYGTPYKVTYAKKSNPFREESSQ